MTLMCLWNNEFIDIHFRRLYIVIKGAVYGVGAVGAVGCPLKKEGL